MNNNSKYGALTTAITGRQRPRQLAGGLPTVILVASMAFSAVTMLPWSLSLASNSSSLSAPSSSYEMTVFDDSSFGEGGMIPSTTETNLTRHTSMNNDTAERHALDDNNTPSWFLSDDDQGETIQHQHDQHSTLSLTLKAAYLESLLPATTTRILNSSAVSTVSAQAYSKRNGTVTKINGNANNDTVVICCVVKNEQLYLQEWLDYNLLALGFDHVYIYDNSDDFNLQQWLDQYPHRDEVTLVHFPGIKVQRRAYRACGGLIKEENRTWVWFGDSDEFLVLHQHDTIQQFCRQQVQKGHRAVNWLTFGTSNQSHYLPLPVTFRFQCRPRQSYPMNKLFKSILRVDDLNHRKISGPHRFPHMQGNHLRMTKGGLATIYHYYFKSLEEYVKKRSRGGVLHGKDDKAVALAQAGLDIYGNPVPIGGVRSDSAWRRLKRFVPSYAEFEHHPLARNISRTC